MYSTVFATIITARLSQSETTTLSPATEIAIVWSGQDCQGGRAVLDVADFNDDAARGRNSHETGYDWCFGIYSNGKEMKARPTGDKQAPKPRSLQVINPNAFTIDLWDSQCHDDFGYENSRRYALIESTSCPTAS